MKIGVIDVGGGYRGIYAAGVLDCCMKNNIKKLIIKLFISLIFI